jgi:hypothetical protein
METAVMRLVSILFVTKKLSLVFDNFIEGVQTVQRMIFQSRPERFEPSSRTFLNGEQPYAWDLLQPRAKVSRHRGAELRRRYGRSGATSLLSPE